MSSIHQEDTRGAASFESRMMNTDSVTSMNNNVRDLNKMLRRKDKNEKEVKTGAGTGASSYIKISKNNT